MNGHSRNVSEYFRVKLASFSAKELFIIMGQTWPLFVYIRSFHMTYIAQI